MNETLPSIEEELTRKALDQLQCLVDDLQSKRITNSEYKTGIDTLFAICSGLVDDEFFELIGIAGKDVNTSGKSYWRNAKTLVKGDVTADISYKRDGSIVTVELAKKISNKQYDLGEEATHEQVIKKVISIIGKLRKSGFS